MFRFRNLMIFDLKEAAFRTNLHFCFCEHLTEKNPQTVLFLIEFADYGNLESGIYFGIHLLR